MSGTYQKFISHLSCMSHVGHHVDLLNSHSRIPVNRTLVCGAAVASMDMAGKEKLENCAGKLCRGFPLPPIRSDTIYFHSHGLT